MKMASSTIRKSASLIVASALDKSTLKNNAQNFFDYKIMLLKRPKQMKAFPDYHVFPGGKYDQLIDQSDEWLKVFLSEQQNELVKTNPSKIKDYFRGLIRENSLGKLIKTNSINNNKNINLNIPLEISFRLCAIRETFEETGLLLAIQKQKSLTQLEAKTLTNYYDSGECSSSSFIKLNKWHDVIKQDSSKFIEMFFDLNLVPDVYGLHEWSNWITPAMEKIRFTTMFFTCFLPSQPAENVIKRTSSEIESLDFQTPFETLDMHKRSLLKLMPPQIYEMQRMLKFTSFKQFSEYSLQRQSQKGLQAWLPIFTSDFKVGLLPGDYMYDSLQENDAISSVELVRLLELDQLNNPSLRINRSIRNFNAETKTANFEIKTNIDLD